MATERENGSSTTPFTKAIENSRTISNVKIRVGNWQSKIPDSVLVYNSHLSSEGDFWMQRGKKRGFRSEECILYDCTTSYQKYFRNCHGKGMQENMAKFFPAAYPISLHLPLKINNKNTKLFKK